MCVCVCVCVCVRMIMVYQDSVDSLRPAKENRKNSKGETDIGEKRAPNSTKKDNKMADIKRRKSNLMEAMRRLPRWDRDRKLLTLFRK